jgi:exodeoxyribonuclease VII small subunit
LPNRRATFNVARVKPNPQKPNQQKNESQKPEPAPDFEQSLTELEALVTRLEQGDIPLEDALKTFERGVALTRQCQTALRTAQQKVEVLLGRSGEETIESFADSDDEETDEDADGR